MLRVSVLGLCSLAAGQRPTPSTQLYLAQRALNTSAQAFLFALVLLPTHAPSWTHHDVPCFLVQHSDIITSSRSILSRPLISSLPSIDTPIWRRCIRLLCPQSCSPMQSRCTRNTDTNTTEMDSTSSSNVSARLHVMPWPQNRLTPATHSHIILYPAATIHISPATSFIQDQAQLHINM